MSYEVIMDNVDKAEWERYAKEFADYNIYQTWPYQQVRAEGTGQQVSRVVIKDESGQAATMGQVRIKKIKPLGLKIGYIQWGPLFCGKNGKLNCTVAALKKLSETYLGTKVNILRVVPNIFEDEGGSEIADMLEVSGFERVPSVSPYHTIVLPLDGPEEAMRKRLHRGWRRNLVKAEKAGLRIREGRDSESFDILEKLYLDALKRKRFKGLDPQEFRKPQSMLSEYESMNVMIAYLNGGPVTALATSNLGNTAVDILAANNKKALECGSSFLVYWKAFCTSKRAGMKRYDLGGIDPEKNPTVYEFKRRTGGKEVFHIGAFEICENPITKRIWRTGEQAYRFVKR